MYESEGFFKKNLFIWLCGMWDLSFLTKDQTCILSIEAWDLNHWTTRESLPKASTEAFKEDSHHLQPEDSQG